jgi:hypothetical protein
MNSWMRATFLQVFNHAFNRMIAQHLRQIRSCQITVVLVGYIMVDDFGPNLRMADAPFQKLRDGSSRTRHPLPV